MGVLWQNADVISSVRILQSVINDKWAESD